MHPKISRWLASSTKLLQARISSDSVTSKQFIEELNLRREAVSNIKTLFPSVTFTSIEGVYQVIGANSENAVQGYSGILTLTHDDNRIFASWLLEGTDVQTGFGVLLNNVLSVNFVYEQEGIEYTGLVSYEFLSDRLLSGIWIEQGTSTTGVEFGRKLPVAIEDPLKYFGLN